MIWVKPPDLVFCLFYQAESSFYTEKDEIKGDGKAPVISFDSHIKSENLAKDCRIHA